MVKSASKLLLFVVLFLAASCSKPSKKDIERKLLLDYVCAETAKVRDLKILKTEETESTGGPHIFNYSITGEIEWPDGCKEPSTNTPAGTTEKFSRLLSLYKTEEGNWE